MIYRNNISCLHTSELCLRQCHISHPSDCCGCDIVLADHSSLTGVTNIFEGLIRGREKI
jgi:hypothetical protein